MSGFTIIVRTFGHVMEEEPIHTQTHIHTHTHTDTHIHSHTHIHSYTHRHTYTHIHPPPPTHTHTHSFSAESASLNNEDNDSVQGVEERPTADRDTHSNTSKFLWYIYDQRSFIDVSILCDHVFMFCVFPLVICQSHCLVFLSLFSGLVWSALLRFGLVCSGLVWSGLSGVGV